MTDPRHDTEIFPTGLEPPGASEGLRDRALRRAGAALHRPPARDRWTRIYASRPLRAAWGAAVLALVVANVVLPRANRRSEEGGPIAETAGRIPELREVVDAPRLREAYVSLDTLADPRPAVGAPERPVPPKKEKTS